MNDMNDKPWFWIFMLALVVGSVLRTVIIRSTMTPAESCGHACQPLDMLSASEGNCTCINPGQKQ